MLGRQSLGIALAAALAPVSPLQAQAAPTSAQPGRITITGLAVTVINSPSNGAPLTREDAPAAPGGPLSLAYRRGEQIDAAFVERQFSHNRMIGQPIEVAAAIDLVQLINAALLRQGYVNSGLLLDPAADPADGAPLALRLVYGRLSRDADGRSLGVTIDWGEAGRRGLEEDYVLSRMPSTLAVPVNAADIERDFRLLSDDPLIRSVRADLRPTGTAGEATLALSVFAAPPYDLYATVANNRTPTVGSIRAAIGGNARSVLVGSDQLAFEYGRTSGISDVTASYAAPLFGDRWRFSVRGGLNNAAVIDPELLALDISARDRFGEAGVTYTAFVRPLTPAGEPGRWLTARALTLGASVLHRQTTTLLFGEPFSFTPGSVRGRSEYTALRGSFDVVDRGPAQVVSAVVTATLGLGGTRSDLPDLAQPPRNFFAILSQFNYARRLTQNRLELAARLTGQWTNDVLYTAERFSIGGSTTVRGYRENLVLADRGVVASLELAQPFSLLPTSDASGRFNPGAFTASVFVDGGWTDNVGSFDPEPRWVAGAGASLLWAPADFLSARATYAAALRDAAIVGRNDLQDRGFQFLVTVRPLLLFRGPTS